MAGRFKEAGGDKRSVRVRCGGGGALGREMVEAEPDYKPLRGFPRRPQHKGCLQFPFVFENMATRPFASMSHC